MLYCKTYISLFRILSISQNKLYGIPLHSYLATFEFANKLNLVRDRYLSRKIKKPPKPKVQWPPHQKETNLPLQSALLVGTDPAADQIQSHDKLVQSENSDQRFLAQRCLQLDN